MSTRDLPLVYGVSQPALLLVSPANTSAHNADMRVLGLVYAALLSACGAQALRSDKVKLSNIQSLTLRKDLETSHRRVSAMPQVCGAI